VLDMAHPSGLRLDRLQATFEKVGAGSSTELANSPV